MSKYFHTIFLLICVAFTSIFHLGCVSQMKSINKQSPASIYSIEYILVNNVKQCLMIRSDNINNPIVLFLHGGPGTSELSLLRYYNKDLEKHFTLVYWEQRGTGKSYSPFLDSKEFTIDQFVKDGKYITQYCLKRFNKNKLIIIGHSWGTIIGTKMVIENPDLYSAYIGIGQEVNLKKGEEIGYNFAIENANKTGNQKAIKELREINEPKYLSMHNKNWFKHLKQQRKWVTYFGGILYGKKDYSELSKIYLKAKEFSLLDMVKFGLGSIKSLKLMWPEIMNVDLFQDEMCFKVPVYFIQGKNDYNSPTELVEEYFDKLNAPKKRYYLFDKSAHNPIFEESDKFLLTLKEIANDTNLSVNQYTEDSAR